MNSDGIDVELSPYAWMSMRDGELVKNILVNAAKRTVEQVRILEWGSGLSTLSYTKILADENLPFSWLALEYDRAFCDSAITPHLRTRSNTNIQYHDDDIVVHGLPGYGDSHTTVVCWNRAVLRPFLGEHNHADRAADLDAYVDFPRTVERRFDVILVDGRKRRRCLLTALDIVDNGGVVLLHDAFRTYYHCAMVKYPASAFIGDELWIGAATDTDLLRALTGTDCDMGER